MSGAADFRSELCGVRETRSFTFNDVELRSSADGKSLQFRGYASTWQPYEMEDMFGRYVERVHREAFDRTLAEGADVMFLLNHEGLPIARSKSGSLLLSTDPVGLLAEAPNLDAGSPLVQTVRSAMGRGDLDAMSMAFRVNRQQWNDAYTDRLLLDINLHRGDVSLVTYPANPTTSAALVARQRRPGLAPERPNPTASVPAADTSFDDLKRFLADRGVEVKPSTPAPVAAPLRFRIAARRNAARRGY